MIALFFRDLKLSIRAGGGAMIGVLFFMTVVAVIPFGVGPDLNLLSRIGPAILWIGALLASLLGLDRPQLLVGGFDRPNIHLRIQRADEEDKSRLLPTLVRGRRALVYAATRKTTEAAAAHLNSSGVKAAAYHLITLCSA